MVLDDEAGPTEGRETCLAVVGFAAAGGATARDLAGLALGSAGLVASEGRAVVEEPRALGLSPGRADREVRAALDVGAAGRLDRPLVAFLSSSDTEVLDVAVKRRVVVVVVPAAGRMGGPLRLLPRAERAAGAFAVAMELVLAAGGTTPRFGGAVDAPAVVFLAAAAVGVAVLVALGELGLRMEEGEVRAGLSTAMAAGSERRTGSDMVAMSDGVEVVMTEVLWQRDG
jgi:hypothetical protein